MRILIVEDEVMIRVGMGKLIENETNHRIIGEAKNGKEGLDLAERYKPDLIITDIRMPEMDGLEMLKEMRNRKIETKAVILTGYAEFDYAQKAIVLGVEDYLLKPIGVEDVKQLLDKLEDSMEKEQNRQKGPETFLRDIYLGSEREYRQETIQEFISSFSAENHSCQLYLGYIGAADANYRQEFDEKMEMIKERIPEVHVILVNIDKLQEILCFVHGEAPCLTKFEEAFCRKIMKHSMEGRHAVWSQVTFSKIALLYEKLQQVQQLMTYSLSFEEGAFITEEKVLTFHEEKFIYPMELENQIKSSICNGRIQDLRTGIQKFLLYMKEHQYSSQNIKHSYLRFLSFLSNLMQEIDKNTFAQIQNQCFIKQIGDARTQYEVEQIFADITELLENTQEKKEDIHNYTIKRAINYIREHFMEGISQEEIAENLDITPEYLSTLFYKEMGVNFSVFLKEFRISYAKRLLKGTDMKIYEIAEAVGYHDAKYFMRVFKEVQGTSPKEYRTRS